MTEQRDASQPAPLQRRTYEAARLARMHPPVLRHENKQLLFAIASPTGTVHLGRLEYSRWPELARLHRADRPSDAIGNSFEG